MLTYIIHMSFAEQSVYTLNPKRLSCEICGKIFETAEMLSYHRSLEHSQNGRPPISM